MGERRELRPVKGRGELPARLAIIEPKDRRGTAYAINGTLSIGRDVDNTVPIDDAYLSGHHARISLTDGGVIVHDLSSRNGTFLNGTRLTEPRPLRIGDRIQIGYTVFEAQ
jgi:pSer/pThr/pTyr-binding forkhead associated (FHA) protein